MRDRTLSLFGDVRTTKLFTEGLVLELTFVESQIRTVLLIQPWLDQTSRLP